MQNQCLLIHSVRQDGQRFRPSDWIERISSSVARFGGDRRLRYDEDVHPVLIEGEKCLYVSPALGEKAPEFYRHIVEFAEKNGLWVEQDECQRRAA
jgi:hypothetical protein